MRVDASYDASNMIDLSKYLRVHGEEVAQPQPEEKQDLAFSADSFIFSHNFNNMAITVGLDAKLFNHTVGFVQARMAAMEEQKAILKTVEHSLNMLQADGLSQKVRVIYKDRIRENVEEYLKNQSEKEHEGTLILKEQYQNMNFILNTRGRKEDYDIYPFEEGGYGRQVTVDVDFGFVLGMDGEELPDINVRIPETDSVNLKIDPLQGGGLQMALQAIEQAQNDKYSADFQVFFLPFDGEQPVLSGTTPEEFYINGIQIPEVRVTYKDASGSLRNTVNALMDQTDIRLEVNEEGSVGFVSSKGRAIEISGDLYKLADMNILNQEDFPEAKINAEALFLEGATLPEYEYSFGGKTQVNSVSVDEFDGDWGKYNVYLLNGNQEIQIGRDVLASGNAVGKRNFMKFETFEAEGLVIRPLDKEGREGVGKGLGGWWRIDDVDVQWTPDKLTYVGKLEIIKPSDVQVLDLEERWGVSEKVEQYGMNDFMYLDLDDTTLLETGQSFIQGVISGLNENINRDQNRLQDLYLRKQYIAEPYMGFSSDSEEHIAASYEKIEINFLVKHADKFRLAHQGLISERVGELLYSVSGL